MTEESTPLETDNDTLPEVSEADTSQTEPAETQSKPEAATSEAETSTEEPQQPDKPLIFGKYKDLAEAEKGYKELEKVMSQKAEIEKKLKAFEEQESQRQATALAEAQKQGFSDVEEQGIVYDVKNHEFGLYAQALDRYLSGDNYNNAYNALLRYQSTLNPADLATAKACFPPEVVSEIAGNVALFQNRKMGEYHEKQRISGISRIKESLENFASVNGEWLNPKERQDIVGLAVQLTGGDIDLNKVKELVDAVENYAVAAYKNKMQVDSENQKAQEALQAPVGETSSSAGEKWLTREEYNNLSTAEEEKFADLIVKQIELEKAGKLPRRLT